MRGDNLFVWGIYNLLVRGLNNIFVRGIDNLFLWGLNNLVVLRQERLRPLARVAALW